jgi:hypothetical protein
LKLLPALFLLIKITEATNTHGIHLHTPNGGGRQERRILEFDCAVVWPMCENLKKVKKC